MTRAEGTRGFPALQQELMWRANFSYEPEYFVCTTQIGPNLVECYASVLLHPRLMANPPERSHTFSSVGSTPEAAIQVYSYNALTCLRRRYLELNNSYTFSYFPYHVQPGVNEVLYPHPVYEDDSQSYRMSKLIRAQDVMFQCYASELNISHKRLGELTIELENLRTRHSYPSIETGAPLAFVVTDLLPEIHLHPVIRGECHEILPQHNRHTPQSELR
jgi:hypothetical protein